MLNEGTVGVTFGEAALKGTATAKVSISRAPATIYPNSEYFSENYPPDQVGYLGPLVTTEIAMSALDWEAEDGKSLILITPSFNEGVLETVETRNVFLEVRILRPDGELVFYTFDYGFFGEVSITGTFLQTNLLGSVPETLKISVQAVDLSRILPNPGALPGTMPDQGD